MPSLASFDEDHARPCRPDARKRRLDLWIVGPQENEQLRVHAARRQLLDEREHVMLGAADRVAAVAAGKKQDVGNGRSCVSSSAVFTKFERGFRAVPPRVSDIRAGLVQKEALGAHDGVRQIERARRLQRRGGQRAAEALVGREPAQRVGEAFDILRRHDETVLRVP